jgi:uncharacterized membrane protein YoaK (UPF0700 family)
MQITRDVLLLTLAAATGWLDAAAYLRAHVFTANMSGNSILLALGLGRQPPGTIDGPATAISFFILGAFLGAWVGERGPSRTASARVLGVEAAVLAALAVVWFRAVPAFEPARLLVIAVGSFAMGLQQAATERLHPQPTASTTYMSGTIERLGTGLHAAMRGKPQKLFFNLSIWIVYLAAAFALALAERADDAMLGVVPFAVLLVVLGCLPFAVSDAS